MVCSISVVATSFPVVDVPTPVVASVVVKLPESVAGRLSTTVLEVQVMWGGGGKGDRSQHEGGGAGHRVAELDGAHDGSPRRGCRRSSAATA